MFLLPVSQSLDCCWHIGYAVQPVAAAAAAVTRCDPEVESRQQLEEHLLAQKRDFAGFVRAMRQQFKQLAAAGQ